ncbi:MAG TPA: GTPase HflX [bacterium]|nr:GTPase HflX [bacterium]
MVKTIHNIQTGKKREKALLVGVVLRGARREQVEESLDELALLADTAGAVVVDTVLQDRSAINPATLIGTGKVHEVARKALDGAVDVVLFDEDLSPVQIKNLEREIKKKVIDRSGLILDIFAGRARTHEAQIQVELAQLKYLYPRLTRQWMHLSRQEGGIGMRGPGETQLEVDRRMIRKKIKKLEEDLKRIEQQRRVRRKNREGLIKISLVGYTNAGKSSLMNVLADADAFVEDRLFATLDATIRAFRVDEHRKTLLIDTVGFIRKLPPHLIASFRSTLEETVESDMLLHVIDVSHPCFHEHIGAVQDVLRELGAESKPCITVFNKIDRLTDRVLFAELKRRFAPAVFTSAMRGIGTETLKREIVRRLDAFVEETIFHIPHRHARLVALLYDRAHVLDKRIEDEAVVLTVRGEARILKRFQRMLEDGDGRAHSDRG